MRATTSTLGFAAMTAVTVMWLTVAAADDAPSLVPAPTAPAALAQPGRTVVTSELALDYQRDTVELPDGSSVTTSTFDFHVGLDRVLPARLTLGGRIGFAGAVSGLDRERRFDLGVRFGGLVPLGGSTIWWPTLGLTYGTTSVDDGNASVTVRTVSLVVSAPFLWQPAHHLLVGVGPTYSRDLQAKTGSDADQTGPKTSGFGIHGLIGFWF